MLEHRVSIVEQKVAVLDERVDHLMEWEKAQNGALKELRDEVNRNLKWTMGTVITFVLGVLSIIATVLKVG